MLYDIANLYYNLGDAFSALQYAEEEMRLNQQYADTLDIIYLRNQTTLANLYSHYDLGKSAAYFTSVVRKITHNEFDRTALDLPTMADGKAYLRVIVPHPSIQ